MRRWFWLGLLLSLCAVAWAQQESKPAPPPPSPADSQDASGLSRDTTFPGDRPSSATPANNDSANKRTASMEPPRSDRVRVEDLDLGAGDSSSKDTQIDLNPPADDAKVHPGSATAVAEAEALDGGITELHVWDPHKAAKSVEVGDFYFKRKNYRAAEDRYREALRYKNNDATATIRLAVCLEKLGILDDAEVEYESYLRILPHGPQASEAQKAIDRLKAETRAKQ